MDNITNDKVTAYLQQLMPEGAQLLPLREYAQVHHVPIAQRETAQFLTVLAQMQKPKSILEFGTAIGYSALLLRRVTDAQIITVEKDEQTAKMARENIAKLGDGGIQVVTGDALDYAAACLDTFDMIFLDSAKGQYPDLLPHCVRMLRCGGLFVSDNVLLRGMVADEELLPHDKKTMVYQMRNYLDMLMQCEELDTAVVPIGDGMALSYKR